MGSAIIFLLIILNIDFNNTKTKSYFEKDFYINSITSETFANIINNDKKVGTEICPLKSTFDKKNMRCVNIKPVNKPEFNMDFVVCDKGSTYNYCDLDIYKYNDKKIKIKNITCVIRYTSEEALRNNELCRKRLKAKYSNFFTDSGKIIRATSYDRHSSSITLESIE